MIFKPQLFARHSAYTATNKKVIFVLLVYVLVIGGEDTNRFSRPIRLIMGKIQVIGKWTQMKPHLILKHRIIAVKTVPWSRVHTEEWKLLIVRSVGKGCWTVMEQHIPDLPGTEELLGVLEAVTKRIKGVSQRSIFQVRTWEEAHVCVGHMDVDG